MPSVIITDDHVLFREGLIALISQWDDFKILGEADNGEDAIRKVRDLSPDIVLMDIAMPVMDGITATEKIKREYPAVRVVMLTISEEDEDLFRALKAGACGYILKNMPAKRLHDLLRGVMNNETPISGVMATKMVAEFNRPVTETKPARTPLESLTEREKSILELLVDGFTNTEIANKLYLSESTIKKDLHNVLEKLHLNNRVEAVAYAIKRGLIKK